MSWTAHEDPVSIPGRGVVYVAAALIALAAAGGAYLGFKASLRDTSHAAASAGVDDTEGLDDAAPARPIVDVTPMQAAPPPAAATNALAAATNATAKHDDDEDSTNDVALRTAAVQAAQNNPAKPAPDIDTLLTSQSERPQAPAKPSADDEPAQQGSTPAKTDVPF
jgi:hypothetical protein